MKRKLKEDDGGRMEYLKALEDALEAENYLCTWEDGSLGKLIVDTDLGMFDIDYVPGEWVYVVHFSGPNREFTKYRKYTDDVVEIVVNVVEDQLDDWSTEHYVESKKSNKKESTLDLFGQNAKVHKDKNWKPALTKKQIKERRMPCSEIPQVEDYVGTARAKGFECIEGSLVSKAKEVFTPVIMKINGNVEARLRIFSQGNYTIFTDKGGWEGLDLEEFEKDLDDIRFLHESVSKKSNKKFQEDSLDDFDIDGKIAKDRASQSEDIKVFVKEFQESVWQVFSQAVSTSMENAGLEYSKYGDKKTYRVYGDNTFGLNYKPGCEHRYEIVLGRYGFVMWNGQLYSSDGPDSYFPNAKHIKEVAGKIKQDIYQCVKDQWDAYNMTSKWDIPFEDCFKIGSIGKDSVGGISSGAFYFKCSFKIPEFVALTENTLNEAKTRRSLGE